VYASLSPGREPHHFLAGGVDGSITVLLLSDLSVLWRAVPHDGSAKVLSAAASYDGAFILSAAEDGLCFVHAVSNVEPDIDEIAERRLRPLSDVPPGVDITNPAQYSLQQEKLKAEHDRQLLLAETKKTDIRSLIAEMRVEFAQLQAANAALHPSERLSKDDFDIDPDYRAVMGLFALHSCSLSPFVIG
jgi:hypothetical protein